MSQCILATAAATALAGLASVIVLCAPVHAHEWYPLECCGRNDCMPAAGVEGDGRGGMTVIAGDMRVGIPEGFESRVSVDGRTHVCLRIHSSEIDGGITATPVCLFLPAEA